MQEDVHRKAIDDRIEEFEGFAAAHPDRMREPGSSGHIVLNEEIDVKSDHSTDE